MRPAPAIPNPTFHRPILQELLEEGKDFILLHDAHRGELTLAERGAVAFIGERGQRQCIEEASAFLKAQEDDCYGCFAYDLKNLIERLETRHEDPTGMPLLLLFPVKTVRRFSWKPPEPDLHDSAAALPKNLKPRIHREQYLKDVRALQEHIALGDIYEVNYCQEFFAEGEDLDPIAVYERLCALTAAPFSALVHYQGAFLLCASPERFLKKEGKYLLSEPIKGTIRRGANKSEDTDLKTQLQNDPKERAENIMITDLVRNDLSRAGKAGSTEVTELCGIYSFRTVHQMISSVRTEVDPEKDFAHILRSTFPMGSMTGAPKVRAMELIDRYEHFARGLYSGSVGRFEASGDFDLNVVIRSIFWNSNTGYLSIRVGGAITALSSPEAEYRECLLKAEALFQALRS